MDCVFRRLRLREPRLTPAAKVVGENLPVETRHLDRPGNFDFAQVSVLAMYVGASAVRVQGVVR